MKKITCATLLILSVFFLPAFSTTCNVYIFKSYEDQSVTYGAHPSPGNPIKVSSPFYNGFPDYLTEFRYVFSRYCKCSIEAFAKKNFKGRSVRVALNNVNGDEVILPFSAKSFIAKCKKPKK